MRAQIFLSSALCCALAVTLQAQDSPVPFPAGAPAAFEFSLSNPGARSLGLGGAFVALADDATAAFANPAGLVKLVRPEVSFEGRRWAYSTPYTVGGRLSGEPTGILLDVDSGTRRARSDESVDDVSFASFVWPGERWSLAVYHHRQIDFQLRSATNGLFGDQAMAPFTPRHPDMVSRNDSLIDGTGFSVGFQISDRWSVGGGFAYFDAELRNYSEFFLPSPPTQEGIFGPSSYSPEALVTTVDMRGEDTDWGFIAGVLWQPNERWGVGGFYREGAEFDVDVVVRSGPAMPGPPPGTALLAVALEPMEFPEVYGLGLARRMAEGAVTLSVEWDHVGYSSILSSFERFVGDTGADLEDADELHLGFEYALLDLSPVLALRCGAWLDPDHTIGSTGSSQEFLAALFPEGRDEWHWAVGVGMAFEGWQLDLAADFSDFVDTVAVSAIYTF